VLQQIGLHHQNPLNLVTVLSTVKVRHEASDLASLLLGYPAIRWIIDISTRLVSGTNHCCENEISLRNPGIVLSIRYGTANPVFRTFHRNQNHSLMSSDTRSASEAMSIVGPRV
jgi:hypothetical protein